MATPERIKLLPKAAPLPVALYKRPSFVPKVPAFANLSNPPVATPIIADFAKPPAVNIPPSDVAWSKNIRSFHH